MGYGLGLRPGADRHVHRDEVLRPDGAQYAGAAKHQCLCARAVCACGRCAGLALGTCPGRACRRRASSRRSRARGRYIARAHGPTRRRAAQRSARACARSSSASCCWMDPMALQPRRLAGFRQWVGEGPSQKRQRCFSFFADAFRLLHEGSLSK